MWSDFIGESSYAALDVVSKLISEMHDNSIVLVAEAYAFQLDTGYQITIGYESDHVHDGDGSDDRDDIFKESRRRVASIN